MGRGSWNRPKGNRTPEAGATNEDDGRAKNEPEKTPADNRGAAATGQDAPNSITKLLRGQLSELSRYEQPQRGNVIIEGRLADVKNADGKENTIWIIVREIKGLGSMEMVGAWIEDPSEATDEVLKAIGKNGSITLEGIAVTTPHELWPAQMAKVHRINDHIVEAPPAETAETEGEQ